MCYTCGCGMLEDDMGHPENITKKNFEESAKAMGMDEKQTKMNTYKALKQELGEEAEQA